MKERNATYNVRKGTNFYVSRQTNAGGELRPDLPAFVIFLARNQGAAQRKYWRSEYSKFSGCNCGCGEVYRFDPNLWDYAQEVYSLTDVINSNIRVAQSRLERYGLSNPTYVILD